MSVLTRALALVLVASVAFADPAGKRVVLADADPELRRAVASSLRPWRLEVVVDPGAPADLATAQARADDRAARFVVWREGDELVVYDRESGQAERRAAQAGAFDPITAAAAALTVKTMMRLPPLPVETGTAVALPAAVDDGPELRFEGGLGTRYERGLDDNVALRFMVAGAIRPWRDRGWRFGALGDLGASATVDQAGFHGTWTNWAVLALASWSISRDAWELGPWLAVGIERSTLDGTQMGTPRTEHTVLPAVRGGLSAHYRAGMWLVGALAGIETLPSTQTYTKPGPGNADVFEIPPFGAILELTAGIDIAP